MVLLKDVAVFSDEALLRLLDDCGLASLVLLLSTALFELHVSLRAVDSKLLLPESFDLALVLLLSHPALLRVHLLQPLVISKLLHQFHLELIFHALLLGKTFPLDLLLVSLGIEEVLLDLLALLGLLPLPDPSLLLELLHVELVPQVLYVLVLSPPALLFALELLEYLFTSGFSLGLLGLDLSLTTFLLLSEASEHLALVLFKLLLLPLQVALLVDRLDHVELRLLLLHADERDHLLILLDHLADNLVYVLLLLKVLLVGFGAQLGLHLHLALQVVLLLQGKALALLFLLSLDQVLQLLEPEHLALHLRVHFLKGITVRGLISKKKFI